MYRHVRAASVAMSSVATTRQAGAHQPSPESQTMCGIVDVFPHALWLARSRTTRPRRRRRRTTSTWCRPERTRRRARAGCACATATAATTSCSRSGSRRDHSSSRPGSPSRCAAARCRAKCLVLLHVPCACRHVVRAAVASARMPFLQVGVMCVLWPAKRSSKSLYTSAMGLERSSEQCLLALLA